MFSAASTSGSCSPRMHYSKRPTTQNGGKSSTSDMLCFLITLPVTFPYYGIKWLYKMADGH